MRVTIRVARSLPRTEARQLEGLHSLHPVLCGRSSPPRQIPSTRAPNTSDVRTTLSVCVESAIRAATAVLGAPPALSSSTALRKYHGGDTEDGRDNECSKHDFISVWSLVPKARRKLHPPVVSLVGSFRFSRRLKSANRQHAPSNIHRQDRARLQLPIQSPFRRAQAA